MKRSQAFSRWKKEIFEKERKKERKERKKKRKKMKKKVFNFLVRYNLRKPFEIHFLK